MSSSQVSAQSVPTGWQEYHVIGREQHVWNMMHRVAVGEGATGFDNSTTFINGMNSVVTATAATDNQVIFYDHWEDGFESDILNPVQATTMVIGDGNAANGQACDFTGDPRIAPCDGIDDDVLFQGSYVNFNSDQGLPGVTPNPDPGGFCQAGLPAPPLDRRCSVPVNPRLASDIRFDGGDRIVSSGGPLSVAHPQDPLSPYIGGATEMVSRQAVQAARSYSIPIGEDIYGGNDSVTEPLKYVDLDLVAFADGTQVFITSPGAGSVSLVLDQGQHYSTQGLIDDATPAPAITVNSGTKVSTSAAVAGLIFSGGDGTFATRMFTLLPDLLHSTDYVLTAPGDDPAMQGSRPLNVYLFNPDPFNAADVTVTDSMGSAVINIPANSMVDYFTGTGRFVPTASTVRLTSDRNFWGVSAYDHASPSNDWGHSWLARRFLTGTYTVLYAPGVDNASYESQLAQRLANDPDCTIPPAGPGVCDTLNRSPVFVAATLDGTQVQVDFDNDGTFDVVDIDGDDYPDAAPLPGNTYVIDALQSLRVYDYFDYDNTGSRIITNKPAALAYGEDTDQATGPDPIQDTGYVVYPISQAFLDPVLTIDKEAGETVVGTAGGRVDYTLTVRSHGFGPLTNLQVWDLLPIGIATTDYATGSSLVTYPDLSQDTADPGLSIDPATGRARLDWSLSPDWLDANRTLTITYSVDIPPAPAGSPRQLVNEAHAQADYGASTFSPLDSYRLVQTDIVMDKSVDLALASQSDVLTYTIQVFNNGLTAETGVVITDPMPPDTTFVAGSITGSGGFAGSFDPAQNAVVWTAAALPVGGPVTLTFQALINPGVSIGTVVENQAAYESNETPLFEVNPAQTTIAGPDLEVEKSGPAVLHPNQVATFEIVVDNSGSGTGTMVLVVDPVPTNASYVAGSMEWSLNSQPFVSLSDAADGDEGTAFADRIELVVASLGANEDLRFRFQVRVDPGTDGQFVNNQATVAAAEVNPVDTNLVQIPILGDADVVGHLFIDADGDGIQGPGEPDLPGVDVLVTDAMGNSQVVATDANGDFLFTVEPGAATLDVDETDPDYPHGAVLTTANEPQVVAAVAGSTVAATDMGYRLPPLTFVKTSDAADHQVAPGQVVTYSLELTNNTTVTQTGIAVTDPVPTGCTAVPGSTQVSTASNDFRVREYYLPPSGGFSGTGYSLALDQDLVPDYFVVIQGSDGDGTDGANRGPDENHVRLVGDPFGTGDLGTSGAANVIELRRGAAVDAWSGVVTVVECLDNCTSSGFTLLDVAEVVHSGAALSGSQTTAGWSDIGRVMLMGGFNGSGCETASSSTNNTKVCHARIFPSGSDQVNWTRNAGGATLSTATSTVMVVQWGSEWTVQRVRVQGNNGGDGADTAGEYNTAAITAVARDHTWVWGTGHTNDQGIGDAAEGVLVTLGDGVSQGAVENQVAVGIEYAWNAVDFEVYALTHPSLQVDHRFKADGDMNSVTVDVTVDEAGGQHMALSSNGQNGTGTAYPRPMLSARYTSPTTVRLERRRWGQPFPAWVQGIEFTDSVLTTPGHDPPGLVVAGDGFSLAPGATMTVTFQVQVDNPLAGAVVAVTNTATVVTGQQGPVVASVSDDVVRPAVMVEPDDAEVCLAGETVTYRHTVSNTGSTSDSFALELTSELGYRVELVDPGTGAVMASDSNGDGTWDGGLSPVTGTLAPGDSVSYDVRVNVPPGTPSGTQETTVLTATSSRWPALASDSATDETIVVGAGDFGPVILLPDHSGVVNPGGSVVYAHRVVNNQGVTDTLSLQATSTLGWTTTIYDDSNGDGVFTPGLDVAVGSTRRLADGETQLFFVVVEAAPTALPGTVDVTLVTASGSQVAADPALTDAVTETTTVTAPELMDLSGGGTRIVLGGSVPVFPGTLTNLDGAVNTFELSLTPSWFFGRDAFLHPTQLVVDTNGDGSPDTLWAEDSDGDGTWDVLAPGADSNGDGDPDVAVSAGDVVAYELRRPVDPSQTPQRDPVTLTARSRQTAESDSITAVNLLASLTEAWLADFSATSTNGAVIVEWETAAEVGSMAFELARRAAGSRDFERVHQAPLGALLHSPQGGVYRFVDHGAGGGEHYEYLLTELDIHGHRKSFGPVAAVAGPQRGHVPAEVFTARPRVLGSPIATSPSRAQVASADGQRSGWVKITTRGSGLVFVDAGELAAAFGVARSAVESWIANGLLSLGGRYDAGATSDLIFADYFESGDLEAWGLGSSATPEGESGEVAWLPAADDAGIYFHARELESIYALDAVYWLRHGRGRLMQSVAGGTAAATPGASFQDLARFEEDVWPFTAGLSDPESDYWFWEYFRAEQTTQASRSVELVLPGVVGVSAPAPVTIRLQGGSDAAATPDHRVQVRLNGTLVADESWDGLAAHTIEAAVDQALLNDGSNQLAIEALLQPGVSADVFYLDSVRVGYRRLSRAVDDAVTVAVGGQAVVTVSGFSTPEVVVLDITDPRLPAVVTCAPAVASGDGYQVSFEPPSSPGRYLVTTLGRAARAVAVVADLRSDLRSRGNGAEHVVIAGSGLETAAQRLADFRSAQGLRSMVVRVADVYDEFSDGVATPWAIRDFIAWARAEWSAPPRWIVLAGDGTFDHRDVLGSGGDLVPAPMTATPSGLVPSDNLLADLGSDGVPEVAIGRIPAATAVELEAYVDKLIAVESSAGTWKRDLLWLADDPDAGGEFGAVLEALAGMAPAGLRHSRVFLEELGLDSARNNLQAGLRRGALLAMYAGHGGFDRLADEGLLVIGDVAALGNAERSPVLAALTCSIGRFDLPGSDGIGERLVLEPGGGVVALWAPSGLVKTHESSILAEEIVEALGTDLTLGEAVQRALRAHEQSGGDADWLRPVFVLLGDPATRLGTQAAKGRPGR